MKNTSAVLTIPAGAKHFTVVIGGKSSLDKDVTVKENAINDCLNCNDFDTVYASNCEYWADFWSKSYVYLYRMGKYFACAIKSILFYFSYFFIFNKT